MTQWALALAVVASCVAAVTDLRTRTIPNWLTLPLALGALALHLSHARLGGLLLSSLGGLVCFLPVYFLFVRGALGGGDVKLFAGLGMLLGPGAGLELELTAFSLVALYALARTLWRGRVLRLLAASYRASLHLLSPSRFAPPDSSADGVELPMGLSILGAALALFARSAV